MKSYFEKLQAVANLFDVDLRAAFEQAGIPSSTFYRAQKRNDMRYATALKVLHAIQNIYASKKSSDG